jgi:hypothetical protein
MNANRKEPRSLNFKNASKRKSSPGVMAPDNSGAQVKIRERSYWKEKEKIPQRL